MTTKDLLEATTPNAVADASDDRLDHLYNLICGGLAGEGEATARQLQARIHAIHAEKARRQAERIASEAKKSHWTVLPNFGFTVIAAVAAILGAYFAWLALPHAAPAPRPTPAVSAPSSPQKPQPLPASPKP